MAQASARPARCGPRLRPLGDPTRRRRARLRPRRLHTRRLPRKLRCHPYWWPRVAPRPCVRVRVQLCQ
eukprot:1341693-Alexandrium_andersonii.AAC.1